MLVIGENGGKGEKKEKRRRRNGETRERNGPTERGRKGKKRKINKTRAVRHPIEQGVQWVEDNVSRASCGVMLWGNYVIISESGD